MSGASEPTTIQPRIAPLQAGAVRADQKRGNDMNLRTRIFCCTAALLLPLGAAAQTVVYVGGSGTGHYTTLQAAVNALPSTGGTINVEPGTYTGQTTINIPNVSLLGLGATPSATILTADGAASTSGGDQASATLQIDQNATNFYAQNIQIQNTYTQEGHTQQQALALYLSGDRTVIRNSRIIGRQDTLYAGSHGCTSTFCDPAREYFYNDYIEGNVDFIFGDGAAVFDTCTMQIDENGSASGETTVTAQSRQYTAYLSGYVFWNSLIQSSPATGMTNDYLGRPWSSLAYVAVVNTNLQAPISTPGWIEFNPGSTDNLPTAYYAEYGSTGPGAIGYTGKEREQYAVYLTSSQTSAFAPDTFLAGSDGWVPTSVSESGALIPNGTYVLLNRYDGRAVTDPSGSTSQGTIMEQVTNTNASYQQWTVNNLGNNVIILTNVASKYNLDVFDNSKSSGGLIDQWSANGATNQEWTVTSEGSGFYALTAVSSGMALSVVNGSSGNDVQLDQTTFNGGFSQEWSFNAP
jgi:pectinesterase